MKDKLSSFLGRKVFLHESYDFLDVGTLMRNVDNASIDLAFRCNELDRKNDKPLA